VDELEQEMTPLCHICRHYGSDKGGNHLKAGDTVHRYTPAYHEMFKDRREKVKNVLEIGVNYGCSLRMWRDYFPKAEIYGLDSNQSCLFADDRIMCFAGDQNNPYDLLKLMDAVGNETKFDLIVDDGSHEPRHQIFSAAFFVRCLAKDGIYVVEDIYPDCKPELIGDPILELTRDHGLSFRWEAVPTGRGLGKAHCGCGCGQGEQLVVLRRA